MIPTIAYMGTTEWLIVGGIVLVLFGGAKLPQLAKGLGEGIREFKNSVSGEPERNDAPEPRATTVKEADTADR